MSERILYCRFRDCNGYDSKETDRFNSFASVRMGDWITQGRKATELNQNSTRQNGPEFLKLPKNEWPIRQESSSIEVPEQIQPVMTAINDSEDSLTARIDVSRFSSYQRLLRVTARVLVMYNKLSNLSFRIMCRPLNARDLQDACMFWVREAQILLLDTFRRGKFKRLGVKIKEDGPLATSGRAE